MYGIRQYLCPKKKAMKEIRITLDREAVYAEVRKLAAYSGKKQTDATDDTSYDVMHITKAEEEMLDPYWDEARDVLMDVLKPFYHREEDGAIVCMMPQNWDEALEGTVNRTVAQYMKSFVAGRWLRLTAKEKEEEVMADADAKMTELRRKLYWKKKPELRI